MRGLKVIEFRYREISDLRFDQPPFLIDYMILILVSDLIFILRDVLDTTIWPTRSYYEERFAKRNQSLIIEGFRFLLCPSMMGDIRLCGVCLSLYVCLLVCLFQAVTG